MRRHQHQATLSSSPVPLLPDPDYRPYGNRNADLKLLTPEQTAQVVQPTTGRRQDGIDHGTNFSCQAVQYNFDHAMSRVLTFVEAIREDTSRGILVRVNAINPGSFRQCPVNQFHSLTSSQTERFR
jgi:hypothetical protein